MTVGETASDRIKSEQNRDDTLRHHRKTGEYLDPFTQKPPAPSIDESWERLRRIAFEDQESNPCDTSTNEIH